MSNQALIDLRVFRSVGRRPRFAASLTIYGPYQRHITQVYLYTQVYTLYIACDEMRICDMYAPYGANSFMIINSFLFSPSVCFTQYFGFKNSCES